MGWWVWLWAWYLLISIPMYLIYSSNVFPLCPHQGGQKLWPMALGSSDSVKCYDASQRFKLVRTISCSSCACKIYPRIFVIIVYVSPFCLQSLWILIVSELHNYGLISLFCVSNCVDNSAWLRHKRRNSFMEELSCFLSLELSVLKMKFDCFLRFDTVGRLKMKIFGFGCASTNQMFLKQHSASSSLRWGIIDVEAATCYLKRDADLFFQSCIN